MDIESLTSEVHRRLGASVNVKRREYSSTYYPTAMEVLGVSVPDLRVVVRDVGKRIKAESSPGVMALAHALIGGGTFEGRHAAYEIVARHQPTMASLKTREVERLGRGIDNWASVDAFATGIAGPTWREGRVTDAAVTRWARSPDRWWRRAAVASTVALNQASRGSRGDAARTLLICEMVVADHDDMVAKALSWALRTLSGHDSEAVARFLEEHESALAARVRREVRNKLRTGYKNPRG